MCIAGVQPLSTVDYPGKVAYVIFVQGCNFHCGYCHNPELLKMSGPLLHKADVFKDIKKRKKVLDAVVISGGEPTSKAELVEIITAVKDMGLPVKLDTNGYRPVVLKHLIENKLVDYIAMDIKTGLDRYASVTSTIIDPSLIKESVRLIMNYPIPYEFRTTVIPGVIFLSEIADIGDLIKGADKYVLQQFSPTKCLDKAYENMVSYSIKTLEDLAVIAKSYVKNVEIRNI